MIKYSITELNGIHLKFEVNLSRKFRVLNNLPKCWEKVATCRTPHGKHESGTAIIYHSTTTQKFYIVSYLDRYSSQIYAEVNGIDWYGLTEELRAFYGSTERTDIEKAKDLITKWVC